MTGRDLLASLLRWGAGGVTLGCLVALLNFVVGFGDTDYGRSFLAALLVLWSSAGLLAGVASRLLIVFSRRSPSSSPGSATAAGGRPGGWRVGLTRAWVVSFGLGLAALAAYMGSAPRFAGFISEEPRNPGAEAAGPPNVILISFDTTRPDHLGAYGSKSGVSPSFDALAARGALFTHAVATSSWTVPSHASYFTGIAPLHLGPPFGRRVDRSWVKLPAGATTLAEIFREAGYHTAGFIGGPTMQTWFGFDQGFEIYADRRPVSLSSHSNDIFGARLVRRLLNIPPDRFLRFLDPPFVTLVNFLHDESYGPISDLRAELMGGAIRWSLKADEVNHRVFRWLDHRPRRPYFLFVHYFDPHDPYEPPPHLAPPGFDPRSGFISYNGLLEAVLKDGRRITSSERETLTAAYDAEIASMDRQLGLLLRRLEAEGDLKNSVIAVVSDHGEAFGEHGLLFHGHSLYGEQTRAVFMLEGRRVPEGIRVKGPVSGIDLAPTLLDLAGLHVAWGTEGRSLVPMMSGAAVDPVPLFSEVFGGRRELPEWDVFARNLVSVESDGMKLISEIDGEAELFDLRSDPGEEVNLASSQPEEVARLQALIDGYMAQPVAGAGENGQAPPPDVLESMHALGYVH